MERRAAARSGRRPTQAQVRARVQGLQSNAENEELHTSHSIRQLIQRRELATGIRFTDFLTPARLCEL